MITAIILAAGQSKRMGQPKMLLPWGETTVLGQVIETVQRAGVDEILVVTGGARERVEKLVTSYGLRVTHNENFQSGEMLSSVQTGLRDISSHLHKLGEGAGGEGKSDAALICLGDQPQVQERCVRAVVDAFEAGESNLVVPSYQMRRGHPWLVARPLWDEILAMSPAESPREFMNRHAGEIQYVNVDTPSILADLDTYEEYLKSRP